jgi:hypothetical protein
MQHKQTFGNLNLKGLYLFLDKTTSAPVVN